MLDIKFIRDNSDKVKRSCQKRDVKCDIDHILELDKKRRELLQKTEGLKAKQKKLGWDQQKKAKEIKNQIKDLGPSLEKTEQELQSILMKIPNLLAEDVPEGKDEKDNKVLRKFKEPTKFDFKPKDHMELGLAHHLIDTEKSAKISGSRFNYLFNEAVFLQLAIIHFVFDTLASEEIIKGLAKKVGNPFNKPFVPVLPPVIAKAEVMKKMDRFDPIEDRYYLEQDDSLLVGSAEHTLGPLHMNEIIPEKDLPIRYIGYSTAFRREAGSYGKDTTGILRRHQFDKAEMESFIQPEHGQKEQDLIVGIQEYFVRQLEIPHQVVLLCAGDMGAPDYRQVDIECWMPGQETYRETHTSDYMTDYQARRLNTRIKRKNGAIEFAYMNDATAIAVGRMLIAIIENYQQKDGSIKVPKALQKYMGGRRVIK